MVLRNHKPDYWKYQLKWHRWFAWHPINVETIIDGIYKPNRTIWLEWVERKLARVTGSDPFYSPDYSYWQYRQTEV